MIFPSCSAIAETPESKATWRALESYLTVFDEEGALDRFEGFASLHGPAFYGLPVHEETVTLERAQVDVPEELALAGSSIVPWHGGQTIGWKFVG